MITKFEIARKAKEYRLQSSTIEKDYVLGWTLIGFKTILKREIHGFLREEHASKNASLISIAFRKT